MKRLIAWVIGSALWFPFYLVAVGRFNISLWHSFALAMLAVLAVLVGRAVDEIAKHWGDE